MIYIKYLSVISLVTILILSACSPFVITSSSGEPSTPVDSSDMVSTGYQPITVDSVEVEVGVGSPIPVHVIVSGNLPDVCSQVEYTEITQDGSDFIINLSATSAVDGCIPDALPFKMGIPLNVVNLPAGSYSATVNGVRGEFELQTGNSSSSLRTADMPIVKDDIQVDSVNIDYGVGSPIPVHAIVSANLPNACAQLGEVRMHRDEKTIFVRLVAHVLAQTDCSPDTLPIRLEVPLSIVNLPEGPYEVNVNGLTASFDPRTAPAIQAEAVVEQTLVPIENVQVDVGVGSPIPVEIVASGTWPDLCSQVSEVKSQINGFQIDVTVLSKTDTSCPPDQLGLPFRFALPVNVVEMEAGSYIVTVNGASATFDLPVAPR